MSAQPHGLSRRERTHLATVDEIKTVSRRLMREQGNASLTLRAVAREMGITPSALYRYFDSRDALLTALIVESYDEVGAVAEQAAAGTPEDADAVTAFMTVAHAFREWSVEHPHAFGLLFGPPVPGYEPPPDTLGHALRVASVLLDLLRRCLGSGLRLRLDAPLDPALEAALSGEQDAFAGLDAPATALALGCWATLLGAISTEVFSHQPPQTALAPRELFALTMERHLRAMLEAP